MPELQPASPTPPRRRRRKAFLILLVALAVAGGIWWWNHPRPLRFLAEFDALSQPLVCDAGFVLQDRAGHFTFRDWNGHARWQVKTDRVSWAGWKGMDDDAKQGMNYGVFTAITDDGKIFDTVIIAGNTIHTRCWRQGKELWSVALPIHSRELTFPDGTHFNDTALDLYRCSPRRIAVEIITSSSWTRATSRMYVIEDGKIIARGTFPEFYLWAPDLTGAASLSTPKSEFYTVAIRGGKLQLHKRWSIPGSADSPEPQAGGLAYRHRANALYDARGLRKRGGGKWEFGGYSPNQRCLLQHAGTRYRCFTPAAMQGWSVKVNGREISGAVSNEGRRMALKYRYQYPVPKPVIQMLYPLLGDRLVDWYIDTPAYLDVYERPGRLRARVALDNSGKADFGPGRDIYLNGSLFPAPASPRLLVDNDSWDTPLGHHITLLGW